MADVNKVLWMREEVWPLEQDSEFIRLAVSLSSLCKVSGHQNSCSVAQDRFYKPQNSTGYRDALVLVGK